jgi:hypothetical protein
MRWLGSLALGLVLWCVTQADALADKRVALVIGNGIYTNAPHLPNPPHDADDVAAALKRVGFDVIRGSDLDQAGMQDAVIRLARAAQSADVGVFYYSGHAIQFKGVNYLMPVDAKLDDEADLYRFTKVDDVIGYLQQAKALKVLVLDSCRDNPLAETLKRSVGLTRAASLPRGLARIEAPVGTIISYATQAGQTAVDGKGRNSPYTAAFLKHIEEPREIGDIFRDISADVYRATGQTQLPELSLSIIGTFYLKGPASLAANLPPQPTPVDPCAASSDHWKSAESIGSLAAFEDHLARFPTCAFAGLAKARIDALKARVAVVAPPLPPARPPRAVGSAVAANDRTPLANVHLMSQAPKAGLAALPAGAPRPVLYLVNNARAPSCGLLPSTPGASMIVPMLQVGPADDNFPYCQEIPEAATFEYGGASGFVFQYDQHDTREDTSSRYFYVLQSGGGLQPLDKLNGEISPENKSIRYMAAWGKARLTRLENEKDAYRTSPTHSIITEQAFLDISRNETAQSCRMTMDLVTTRGDLRPVTTPCKAILASTGLSSGNALYLIVLTESMQNQARGQIFVVQGNAVREDFGLESKLAAEIGSREILKVKAALRKLVEPH